LYVDNVKAADVSNYDIKSGKSVFFPAGKRGNELLNAARKYCEQLPPVVSGGKKVAMNLNTFAILEALKYAQRRDRAPLKDTIPKALVFGSEPNYYYISLPKPIAALMKSENGRALLAKLIKETI